MSECQRKSHEKFNRLSLKRRMKKLYKIIYLKTPELKTKITE